MEFNWKIRNVLFITREPMSTTLEGEIADIVREEVSFQIGASGAVLGKATKDGLEDAGRLIRCIIREREVFPPTMARDTCAWDELFPVSVKIDRREQIAIWSENQEPGKRIAGGPSHGLSRKNL